MKQNTEIKISYIAAYMTTIVSVTLVLLLLGIIALVWTGATKETRRLKERIELCVVMADSVSDQQADSLCLLLKGTPYANDVKLITKRQALENWTSSTGENLEDIFGVNPLSPEISFNLKEDFTTPHAINRIKDSISMMDGVEEVATPDLDMVNSMNHNLNGVTLVLLIVAAVMIVISFVLINNTVHLTVYSKRFSIHTMQLVGATNGFIRKPFILNNVMSGIISGLVADLMIAVALLLAPKAGISDIASYVSWLDFGIIAVGLVVTGALVCLVAAVVATHRYLRMEYDQLFR